MSYHKKIIIVLLAGFLFRIFIIFCLPVRKFDPIQSYHYSAINMLEGRGYSHFEDPPYQPNIFKPPVYSIFLAIIYKTFGVNRYVVKIIQALLDTVGCLLLFYLLRHYFDKRLAFFGLTLAAFCPITAIYTNLANPEGLTLFFMILSLWLVSKSVHSGSSWFFFAAGVSTILMSYSRPEFFSFIFIFGGYLFVCQMKKGLKKVLLYALGVFIIMAPWVWRNYSLTGKFIPICEGGIGITLFHGTLGEINNADVYFNKFLKDNPEVKSKYEDWYKVVTETRSSIEEKINADKALMKIAIDNIRKNPWKYVLSRIIRMPRVWIDIHASEWDFIDTQKLRMFHLNFQKIMQYVRDDPKEIFILGVKYILLAVNIFYILMALRGLWSVRRELLKFSLVILPLLYAQIFFFFIHISPNYVIPYWSCIIFFSAIGLYNTLPKRFKIKE